MELLIILAVLFAALFIIVPLIERSKVRISDEETSKISRWILPLIVILLVVQVFMFMGD
ncbi:hypothetical protein [Alteromonas facilis]|uniref:hypothetical protein n=1 Tax=Alteromonas facilis TaxID=2048004 RepID=UPI0013DCEFEB|nr:hypothetical protein [Alteromonas facilis]